MKKIKLSVFSSGVGSNLLAIHKASIKKNFPGKLNLVICDKICPAFKLAKSLNYETKLISSIDHKKFETLVHDELIKNKIDLICLAGFMKILSSDFIKKFRKPILNIHPSLLPKYKGLNTHRRAIKNNDKFSGATVHLVTSKLDSGKIILQKKVRISKTDTEQILAKKVLKIEHKIYPAAIEKFLKKNLILKEKV